MSDAPDNRARMRVSMRTDVSHHSPVLDQPPPRVLIIDQFLEPYSHGKSVAELVRVTGGVVDAALDKVDAAGFAAPLDPVAVGAKAYVEQAASAFVERLNAIIANVVAAPRGVAVINESLGLSPLSLLIQLMDAASNSEEFRNAHGIPLEDGGASYEFFRVLAPLVWDTFQTSPRILAARARYDALSAQLEALGIAQVVGSGNSDFHLAPVQALVPVPDAFGDSILGNAHTFVIGASTGGTDSAAADFSSQHEHLTVLADGTDVGPQHESGTSFAAPQISGLIAELRAKDRALSNEEIREILRRAAVDTPAPARKDGAGILDFDRARALAAELMKTRTPSLINVFAAPPLEVTIDAAGRLVGTGLDNVSIEALNLTTAPGARRALDDTRVIGRSDASGRVLGMLAGVASGDRVRLRTRDGAGRTGPWRTVRVSGEDARPIIVAHERISLEAAGGKITPGNVDPTPRPISEPFAVLTIENRTQKTMAVVTLDEVGQFPAGFSFAGDVGDEVVIDGVALRAHANSPKARGALPLFDGEPSAHEPRQGMLGDCFLLSTLSAIAARDPKRIKELVRENDDGTYTVTFATRSITVDDVLHVRANGQPLYAASAKSQWAAIVEKAYAELKGGYPALNGGEAADVLRELGSATRELVHNELKSDDLWTALQSASAAVFSTFQSSRLYANSGIQPQHAYAVIGTREAAGKRYVTVRNPWGEGEPDLDGIDDGVFELELSDALARFKRVEYATR